MFRLKPQYTLSESANSFASELMLSSIFRHTHDFVVRASNINSSNRYLIDIRKTYISKYTHKWDLFFSISIKMYKIMAKLT